MGKLRRRPESSVLRVEGAREEGPRVFERPRRHDLVAFRLGLHTAERFDQRLGLLAQLAAALGVEVADPAQDVLEGGQAETRRLREIGAAEEGDAVLVVQEHRQGPPAAATGEQVLGALVDLVEVRTLFAVDLDVDEEPVHQLRGLGVLEGLVGHHVAPVASGVAHRQQDRPALAGGPFQGLVTPRVPVDRIVGVLEEVGAGLGRESVGVRIGVHSAGPRSSAGAGAQADGIISGAGPGSRLTAG